MANGRMIDNELGGTCREERGHGIGGKQQKFECVEENKISGRMPQNFRFLPVFQVSGAFAYSSKASYKRVMSFYTHV
jgi:hypothetical protein